jgi:opacity protein-like surface antigen
MRKVISVVLTPTLAQRLRHRQGRTIVKTPISSEDWSYQVQGGLEFQLTRSMWTQGGWRYFKYDYVSAGFTNKTASNGPFV